MRRSACVAEVERRKIEQALKEADGQRRPRRRNLQVSYKTFIAEGSATTALDV